jgi:hygromycin-B 7''-O-kinase
VDSLIEAICRKEGIRPRNIQPLKGGQVNQVYRVDTQYVLRVGARQDAFQRLKRETDLVRSLPADIPAPKIYAFGEHEGSVYQVQQFMPGQKLYAVWKELSPSVQEDVVAELAACLKSLHNQAAPCFGNLFEDTRPFDSWGAFLSSQFDSTLADIDRYQIQIFPGYVELARAYFDRHRHVLEGVPPAIVHGDLSGLNILVENGRLSAILDFEYALQAPRDYELLVIEEFCLYPNDYAEEENEVFCAGDFAALLPLLRKHAPALFEIPHLRERVDLYHLVAALGSHIEWRKANLGTIPANSMAAKEFYMARIANFTFRHGVRLF